MARGAGGASANLLARRAGRVRSRIVPARSRSATGLLALGALGVVFGDIGTSPLYAFSQIFDGAHDLAVQQEKVLGALSLIFWTLTLIVSVKYVLIVMRADNEGEGGIMALASLATSAVRRHRAAATIMVFGVIGAALFYGDGMITPAISVLSAVEGLELVEPSLADFVVPIALVLLVGLFCIQRFGTGRVGAAFGPVMLLWFVIIGVLGLVSVVQTPAILESVNPIHAFRFIATDPGGAFFSLGAVVLCVTGAEALYADMGQFGRLPIRLSWFVVAAPCLYLNYLGQGALVLRDPTTIDNSFYLLVPTMMRLPMIILATVATIIASQAVISGAFSMTQQAIRLGYLPRMTVLHTSASERGQIYVPFVNWLLMVAIIGLVIGFQDSSNLASAYGIAVTGTFLITTCLITVVARRKWNLSWVKVAPLAILFLIIDGSFFAANLTKLASGGWFPIIVAIAIFAALSIWRWGSNRLKVKLNDLEVPMDELSGVMGAPGVTVLPGSLVYVTLEEGVPYSLIQRVHVFHSITERMMILRLVTAEVPRIDSDARIEVISHESHLIDVRATYGFMERPDPAEIVSIMSRRESGIDPETCFYSFYAAHVQVGRSPLPEQVAAEVYAFMQRNATDPQRYYGLPPERVIEVGRLVTI